MEAFAWFGIMCAIVGLFLVAKFLFSCWLEVFIDESNSMRKMRCRADDFASKSSIDSLTRRQDFLDKCRAGIQHVDAASIVLTQDMQALDQCLKNVEQKTNTKRKR